MTQLNENTVSLQEVLEAVNNLPEADGGGGGGASFQTCEVTFIINGASGLTIEGCYTNTEQEWVSIVGYIGTTKTYTVLKNTMLVIREYNSYSTSYQVWADNGYETAFVIDKDGTITCN